MKNKHMDRSYEDISALIREEEEEALAVFRARNFRVRLEARLKEAAAGEKLNLYPRTRIVPALTGILVFIVAGIIFLVLRQPAPSPLPEFKAFTYALGQLPGFSHPPRKEWTAPAGRTETSRLAESVRLVLVSAGQTKQGEERRISTTRGTGKTPRLSIEQRLEILFKERAIERALFRLKNDSREV